MFSKRIDDPESGLKLIHQAICNFDASVFLYAVKFGDIDVDDLSNLTDEIARYREYLQSEYDRLEKAGPEFIGTYATDHNQLYSNANLLLNRMKRGIKMTKDLYAMFCPKQSRYAMKLQRLYGLPQQAVWTNSFISSSTIPYSQDMFGFEGYSQYVHGCYVEMVSFFSLLQKCIEYCHQMIKKEKEARNDKDYIKYIYDKQARKIMKSIKNLLDIFSGIDEKTIEETNPILKGRKEYGDTVTNLQHNYHNCNGFHIQQTIAYDYFVDKRKSQYTALERKLFLDDVEMMDRVRTVISNFDFIIPSINRTKIDASLVAMFVYWCGTGDVKNTVMLFNSMYKGKYDKIQDTAVYKHFRELVDSNGQYVNNDGFSYKDFLGNIENLLKPTIVNSQNEQNPNSLIKINSPLSIAE